MSPEETIFNSNDNDGDDDARVVVHACHSHRASDEILRNTTQPIIANYG
jgi:hypothetical protein